MSDEQRSEEPDGITAAVADFRAWRTAHPQATFAELEAAAEERLRRIRVALLSECDADADTRGQECPVCRVTMARRGRRQRDVVLPGDQRVTVTRSYQVCPHCGVGLFPPG